jgi:hypothetical protein
VASQKDGQELIEQPGKSSALLRFLRGLLMALILIQALFFAIHAYRIIQFPHDVDNGEGFILWQSLQYAEGELPYQPIDEPPHLVSNYPPLYPLLCSIGTGQLGPTFAVGRSLSTACSILICLVIMAMIFQQTRQWAPAMMGLYFIGTYHAYDWGAFHRVDMLALFFSVSALALCVSESRWLWVLLLSVLALFTRQTALAAPLAIGFFWISQLRVRDALLYWICLAGIAAGVSAALHFATGGEYLKHIITYNANYFSWGTVFHYVRHMWGFYAILCALGLFYLIRSIQLRRWSLSFWFLIFSSFAAILSGKVGSAPNYLLELQVSLCWIAGLVWGEIRTVEGQGRRWLEILLPVLLIMQMLENYHVTRMPPYVTDGRFDLSWTPDRQDIKREEIFAYTLKQEPGPMLIEDPGLALRTGQKVVYQPFICTQLEIQGLWDPAPLLRRIQNQEFTHLVLRQNMNDLSHGTSRFSDRFVANIHAFYKMEGEMKGRRTFYIHIPREEPLEHERLPEPEDDIKEGIIRIHGPGTESLEINMSDQPGESSSVTPSGVQP